MSRTKNMNKITNKIKIFFSILIVGLLLSRLRDAQVNPSIHDIMFISFPEIFLKVYFRSGIALSLVIAPIVGLIWYLKRRGIKKLVNTPTWVVVMFNITYVVSVFFSGIFLNVYSLSFGIALSLVLSLVIVPIIGLIWYLERCGIKEERGSISTRVVVIFSIIYIVSVICYSVYFYYSTYPISRGIPAA